MGRIKYMWAPAVVMSAFRGGSILWPQYLPDPADRLVNK